MIRRVDRPRRGFTLALAVLIALAGTAVAAPVSMVTAQIACVPATPATAAASPVATATIPTATFPQGDATVVVFAAASLTDVFAELETQLEAEHEGLEIVVETGGSQALVTQLQEGAAADVLATANISTMATAVDSSLIAGTPVPFTGNRLVIVTPSDNPAGITALDDLAGEGVRLVLANEEVPAGAYARQALCAWDSGGDAPDGALDAIGANVVSEEEDVRNVLVKVQLGEADAGIVYASDAVASELAGTPLNVVAFPEGVPVTATYPIAATASGDPELAAAFIGSVLSADGQSLLERYGFSPVDG